ncbi:MAG: chromate efflux transporter, partial [Deltaproteobacteria bacterium]|nr:chromate efflux transporter [Deltaproteobacteria bacterium]
PSFSEAFRFWLKLGFISFGGPAGQISIMYQELVENRRWVSNERFMNALNYCMLLPGPEAQQLAAYLGWLLQKIPGGIVAGVLFLLPSMFILFGLSYTYAALGDIAWVSALFEGLKAAVMAVVLAAVIKIGKKALKNVVMILLAAASFVAIFFLKVPFPWIVLTAGLLGLAGSGFYPQFFLVIGEKDSADSESGYVQICEDEVYCHINPSRKRDVLLLIVFFGLWLFPMLGLYFLLPAAVFFNEGLFFTKAAFLTFGGAYAVLAYIAQAGVEQFGWLSAPEMMDGLGLAETTPGPLIMVVQFVGFMAGWNDPGPFSPFSGAIVGSLVASYFTFLPCFLFIFLGAPYIEKFRGNQKLTGALSSITAAVVGVVLNLAVWFGLHVLFPADAGFNWFAAVIGLGSFIAIQWGGLSIIKVILIAGGIGVLRGLIFG